ncbi:MAG: exported protein of unknown function [Nitrospira sp.]|jgi:hypothetical protein|nr:exported protein of unknown function [Nitrospira sp.]
MKHSVLSVLMGTLFSAGLLMAQACSHTPMGSDHFSQGSAPSDMSDEEREKAVLAGEWEYEEGGLVVPLRLDRFGNGTYDYKEGRFRTDLLSDHRWAGAWIQRANGREGGFEISLSPNYSEGDGRWWYTRMEGDPAPQKGGRFRVLKVKSIADNQSLPREHSR